MKKRLLLFLKVFLPVIVLYGIYYYTVMNYGQFFLQVPVISYKFKNGVIANTKLFKKKFELIILGDSSTAYSIMPVVLGKRSVNLSGWGGSSLISYYMLKRYLDNHSHKPGCVLFSNSHNTDLHYKDKLWTIYILLEFFSVKELSEIYDESVAVNGYPSTEMNYFEFMLKSILSVAKLSNMPEVTTSKLKYIQSENFLKIVKQMIADRGFTGNIELPQPRHSYLDDELKFFSKGFIPHATDDYYFKKILELGREKGIKILFLPSPLASRAGVFNPDQYRRDSEYHLKKIMQAYPESIYLAPIPVDNKNFITLDHINTDEAFVYSGKLKEQIQAYCTLE
ncbi:MAG: hypothetical protein WC635_14300 [Bacteriovorax sp.]